MEVLRVCNFLHSGLGRSGVVMGAKLLKGCEAEKLLYQKIRGLSMDEVKRTNGRIDFEDVLLSERGV